MTKPAGDTAVGEQEVVRTNARRADLVAAGTGSTAAADANLLEEETTAVDRMQ